MKINRLTLGIATCLLLGTTQALRPDTADLAKELVRSPKKLCADRHPNSQDMRDTCVTDLIDYAIWFRDVSEEYDLHHILFPGPMNSPYRFDDPVPLNIKDCADNVGYNYYLIAECMYGQRGSLGLE